MNFESMSINALRSYWKTHHHEKQSPNMTKQDLVKGLRLLQSKHKLPAQVYAHKKHKPQEHAPTNIDDKEIDNLVSRTSNIAQGRRLVTQRYRQVVDDHSPKSESKWKHYQTFMIGIDHLDGWLMDTAPRLTTWRKYYKMLRWMRVLKHYVAHRKMDGMNRLCVPSKQYRGMEVLFYTITKCGSGRCNIDLQPVKAMIEQQCSHTRGLIFVDLAIFFADQHQEGHANCLVIDTQKQTVERFEPHGLFVDELNKALKKEVQRVFADYQYVSPIDFVGLHGPQHYQQKLSDQGFCIAFSFLYFHLRMLHQEMDRRDIVAMIAQGDAEEIDERIKKFVTKIDNFVPDIERSSRFDAMFSQ